MFNNCCVPKCKSTRRDTKLHNIPLKSERRKTWIKPILSKCPDINTEEWQILHSGKPHLYVCHKHFERKFIKETTLRLKSCSVPTLFTDRELATGVPATVDPETVVQESTRIVDFDHIYTSRKIHVDHTYPKQDEDDVADAWMDQPPVSTKSDLQPASRSESPEIDCTLTENGDLLRIVTDTDVFVNEVSMLSPGLENGESIETETDSREERIFSWQKKDLIEADDPENLEPDPVLVPEEPKKAEDISTTLSLFCDEPDPPSQAVHNEPVPAVVPDDIQYRCEDCVVFINDFSHWCVQCVLGALCGACAAAAPHDAHYVLRAPKGAAFTQIQPVLLVIRDQLQKDNLLTLYGNNIDGVKVEIKEELEEALSPAAVEPRDPLALEPYPPCAKSNTTIPTVDFSSILRTLSNSTGSETFPKRHNNLGETKTLVETQLGNLRERKTQVETELGNLRETKTQVETQLGEELYLEGEPHTVQLDVLESYLESMGLRLEAVEPPPGAEDHEPVELYLEGVEGPSQIQTGAGESRPEADRPTANECIGEKTVDHHPFKHPRLMEHNTSRVKPNSVSDVQQQSPLEIPSTLRGILNDHTRAQKFPKIQPSNRSETKTQPFSSEIILSPTLNVQRSRLKTNKTLNLETGCEAGSPEESHLEAADSHFQAEEEEPHPEVLELHLEETHHLVDPPAFELRLDLKSYLESIGHTENVNLYLDALQPQLEAAGFRFEDTELHFETVELQPESEEPQIEPIVNEGVDEQTDDLHHPPKRPRLMEHRKTPVEPSSTITVVDGDVPQQSLVEILSILEGIRSNRTGSQTLQTNQTMDIGEVITPTPSNSDIIVSRTKIIERPKSYKSEPSDLKRPSPQKVQILSKRPFLRFQNNDPKEILQIPRNIPRGLSAPMIVTSDSQPPETVVINIVEGVDEFVEEVEILDSDTEEDRLHTGNQEDRVHEASVEDVEREADEDLGKERNEENQIISDEDRIDESIEDLIRLRLIELGEGRRQVRLNKETQSEGDKDSNKDYRTLKENRTDKAVDFIESEVDDSDLDKDYEIEDDRMAEDSTDETDVEDIAGRRVGRRTRNAAKTPVKRPIEAIDRKLYLKAFVQLKPLTPLDIRKWTADRKRRRED